MESAVNAFEFVWSFNRREKGPGLSPNPPRQHKQNIPYNRGPCRQRVGFVLTVSPVATCGATRPGLHYYRARGFQRTTREYMDAPIKPGAGANEKGPERGALGHMPNHTTE
jgi:hypothetical protein